jgi:hypothetical protein
LECVWRGVLPVVAQVGGWGMGARLTEIVAEVIAEKREAWLIEVETAPCPVHLLVEVEGQFGVHGLVKTINGRSSRKLSEELQRRRLRLPTVDELVFRRDGGRGAALGDQTSCGKSEEQVSDAGR